MVIFNILVDGWWCLANNRSSDKVQGAHQRQLGQRLKCLYIPLEVGIRGFINAKNKNILTKLCHSLRINKASSVVENCSKLAVLGPFSIWNARYSSDWNGGAVLKHWWANTHSDSLSNSFFMYFFLLLWFITADALPVSWCSTTLGSVWSLMFPLNTVAPWCSLLEVYFNQ